MNKVKKKTVLQKTFRHNIDQLQSISTGFQSKVTKIHANVQIIT